MLVSRKFIVNILSLVNGILIGIFLMQTFFLRIEPLAVSLEQVLTLALSSAIVYFSLIQSRYMAQQTRYHIEQNRPRFKIIHRYGSEFLLTNIGKTAAWNISAIFYQRTYAGEDSKDKQIIGNAIEMILPDEKRLLNVTEDILSKIRNSLDYSLVFDIKYDDLPENGFQFQEEMIVNL